MSMMKDTIENFFLVDGASYSTSHCKKITNDCNRSRQDTCFWWRRARDNEKVTFQTNNPTVQGANQETNRKTVVFQSMMQDIISKIHKVTCWLSRENMFSPQWSRLLSQKDHWHTLPLRRRMSDIVSYPWKVSTDQLWNGSPVKTWFFV